MPAVRQRTSAQGLDCSLSPLAIAPKADGAALLLLAHPAACRRWGLRPRSLARRLHPGRCARAPMLCAQQAALALLRRHALAPAALGAVELHDAFAAQGLAFAAALGLPWQALSAEGSGLARGHPIGASGAIAGARAGPPRRSGGHAASGPGAGLRGGCRGAGQRHLVGRLE